MNSEMIIKGQVRDLKLSQPILYMDNEARGRSGHMGHPMLDLGGGRVMDFTSNVSSVRCDGHSGFGWMEYRLSQDGGDTFGEVRPVPYTVEVLLEGIHSAIIEAAVVCDDGTVVAVCNLFSQEKSVCCDPYGIPTVIRSHDMGESWEAARPLSEYEGRVYCARYHEGKIYVLEFCNREVIGEKESDLYRIFCSSDSGESFRELCTVPFESTRGRFYGTMQFGPEGQLTVYAYNSLCESRLDYAVSPDGGASWSRTGTCYLAKRIRNPQAALLGGQYILHGREAGEVNAFVLYTSKDGIHWDEGHRIVGHHPGTSFYSNNVTLTREGRERLLVQYSQTYSQSSRVNIYHMWIESL